MELLFEIPYSNNLSNSRRLKTILQDQKTEDIYGVFVINEIYKVVEIITSDGKFSEQKKACPAAFLNIFNINNKYAYSVYYDPIKRESRIIQTKLDLK